MQRSKSLAALAIMGASTSASSAAIIPSWRINPISPAAIAVSPSLANAKSVSLMVELTGGSLFNVAGLDLTPVLDETGGGVQYFNQATFGSNTAPNSALFPLFPDLEFDSYVTTTSGQPPSVPGRLNGIGPGQVGTEGQFNVAWGATPNSGGIGLLEIARITVFNAVVSSINVPITRGLVADSLNPNTNIALPPIPLVVIPEPMSLSLVGVGMMLMRRR